MSDDQDDNNSSRKPPAASALEETVAAAISNITVEDASDDEYEKPSSSSSNVVDQETNEHDNANEVIPSAPAAAAAHQFNFNLPDEGEGGDQDEPHLDFANLNLSPNEINAHFLSLLPPCILPRIERLKSLSEDRAKLLEQYLVERAALEAKYNGLMKPLYDKRREVIVGHADEEIQIDATAADTNTDINDEQQQAVEVKGIPQFWACAMGHMDILAELITDSDIDCLSHLTDITCNDFPDGSGFELQFHFHPNNNEFFTNTVLSKRYDVPNLLTEDEPMLQNVTGTEIDWKGGKSLTHRVVTKKQRKKGGPNAGQIRTVQKTERVESFFHFFTPPKMPELGDVVEEEEADAMEEHFDHDYEVACAIRGSLIPNAVGWFTGEAVEDMMYGEEEEMAEMLEGGEEGGSGGFVFNPNNRMGRGGDVGGNPFPPPVAGEGENPECKQN